MVAMTVRVPAAHVLIREDAVISGRSGGAVHRKLHHRRLRTTKNLPVPLPFDLHVAFPQTTRPAHDRAPARYHRDLGTLLLRRVIQIHDGLVLLHYNTDLQIRCQALDAAEQESGAADAEVRATAAAAMIAAALRTRSASTATDLQVTARQWTMTRPSTFWHQVE
jgi:hypothetical protein